MRRYSHIEYLFMGLGARCALLWVFLCLSGLYVQGQVPDRPADPDDDNQPAVDSLDERRPEPEDPFRFDPGNQIRVFYPGTDRPDYTFIDTVFGPEFLQYDPARRNVDIGHLHGGYVGSAIFPTYFNYQREMGFEVGHRAYDLYKLNLDTLPYYESDVAYSDVMYAQGASQVETQTEANFGTQFKNQYISVNYRRINNTGPFNNQRAVHTALSMGYLYQTGKSTLNVKFGSNVIQDRFNNGIQTDTLFGDGLAAIGSNIPVISQETQGRHQERRYMITYDRAVSNWAFMDRWQAEAELDNSYIKVFDEAPDSAFYSPFYIDDRGLRQFISWSKWKGRFQFSKQSSGLLRYTAGLRAHRVRVEQEPIETSFWEWGAYGRLQLELSEKLNLLAKTELGAQDNRPEYFIEGRLKAGGELLSLSALYSSSSLVPDLVEQQMYLRNELLYGGSISNVFHNQLGGDIASEKLGISAELYFHNIENFRFWRQGDIAPRRTNLSLLQFKVKQNWAWRGLVNENVFAYQITDSDLLPVPEWQGRHNLFIDTRILGQTLHIRTGLELRYYLNYTAPQFQPFYGSFFVVNDAPFDSFPFLLDYFFAFDVQSFHVLLRLENLNSFINPTRFYTLNRHPSNSFGFRLALRWRIPG